MSAPETGGDTPLASVRRGLRAHGLAPSKRLGQHFMIEPSAIAALVDAVGPPPRRVMEIGPGTGVLTEALLAAGHRLLACELDAGLVALLRERFAEALELSRDGDPALVLLHGDALDGKNRLHPDLVAWSDRGPWVMAANLPYDASLPILLNALQLVAPPALIVVTVQYEAARRLCAAPGDDAWGATAAVAQAAGTGDIIRILPPTCFHPRPRVRSAILSWTPQRPVPVGFGVWCRRIFAYRRKVIPRALRDAGLEREAAQAACRDCGIDPTRRIEQLSVADLLHVFAVVEGGA